MEEEIENTAYFVVDAPNTENLKCPFTVLVESPYADNIPVMVAPYASKLSMYAKVADPIVALLNLILPLPGSESSTVVAKVCATTTAAPEFRTLDVTCVLTKLTIFVFASTIALLTFVFASTIALLTFVFASTIALPTFVFELST